MWFYFLGQRAYSGQEAKRELEVWRRKGVGRKGSGKQEQVARVSSPKAVLPPAKGEEEKKKKQWAQEELLRSKALVAREWRKWVEHWAETVQFWPTLSLGTNGPRREVIRGCLPIIHLATGPLFLCCLSVVLLALFTIFFSSF